MEKYKPLVTYNENLISKEEICGVVDNGCKHATIGGCLKPQDRCGEFIGLESGSLTSDFPLSGDQGTIKESVTPDSPKVNPLS